jgi:hypothetical protein
MAAPARSPKPDLVPEGDRVSTPLERAQLLQQVMQHVVDDLKDAAA